MPRKGFIAKREVLPDPMYNNIVVTKLINNIMLDGKKGVAQSIVYGAFEIIAEKTGKDAVEEITGPIPPAVSDKAKSTGDVVYIVNFNANTPVVSTSVNYNAWDD